jgi:alkanesulfonate monooxygenase SsuD/methylene tetrahydromethanopterin reductase-like flavin-dependent oxidoreductase (luciferase family)
MANTPLAVLDLVPIPSGGTAAQALRNSIDLARHAERLGYARYWFAEHHLNPGVASTSPAVVLALTASATSAIRIGSGAVQLGHRTALATVEEFGLIDALHPGRLDLGLGRSGGRSRRPKAEVGSEPAGSGPPPGTAAGPDVAPGPGAGNEAAARPWPQAWAARRGRAPNGLLIPPPHPRERLLKSPLVALQRALLQLPNAEPQDYGEQVRDILALLRGSYSSPDGVEAHAIPGEGAQVQVWILGSSGGESAQVAARNGLRFAANYHITPTTVLEAADAYRAAFRPSPDLAAPYLSVSADAVVAEDEATARELAAGYGLWVRSIRTGEGAIPFPTPAQARGHTWTQQDRALVADRVDTQFVGTPRQVAGKLEQLRDATGADELIITTITYDHADRVRSYRLLAQEWGQR